MRRRLENGDDVRPSFWVGTVSQVSERNARAESALRFLRRDAFLSGMLWGMAIEGALVIAAIVMAFAGWGPL